jgi:hypothetical protein
MPAIETFYRIKDGKGQTSMVTIPIPSTTDSGDIADFTTAMAGLLDDLIHGGIDSIGFSLPVDWTAQIPDAASDVQEAARFSFRTVGNFIKKVVIPAIWENKFVAGSTLVNQAETNVAAWLTAMTGGLSVNGHQVRPCNAHEEDIESLDVAVEAWGRARG